VPARALAPAGPPGPGPRALQAGRPVPGALRARVAAGLTRPSPSRRLVDAGALQSCAHCSAWLGGCQLGKRHRCCSGSWPLAFGAGFHAAVLNSPPRTARSSARRCRADVPPYSPTMPAECTQASSVAPCSSLEIVPFSVVAQPIDGPPFAIGRRAGTHGRP